MSRIEEINPRAQRDRWLRQRRTTTAAVLVAKGGRAERKALTFWVMGNPLSDLFGPVIDHPAFTVEGEQVAVDVRQARRFGFLS
jgi:hypothetical protein